MELLGLEVYCYGSEEESVFEVETTSHSAVIPSF